MLSYTGRRLLIAIPTLLGVAFLVFSMVRLLPGDPVDFILAHSSHAVQLDPEVIRHQLGLDKPAYKQFFSFLNRVVHGDLGRAYSYHMPVLKLITQNLPYTGRLTLLAMTFVVILGLLFGILGALKPNSWFDSIVMTFAVVGVSMPNFWIGMLLILLFCVKLQWLPLLGPDSLKTLFLPAFALSLRSSAILARVLRSSLLEVMNEDYIRTSRAKGLREITVFTKHALRNAILPVLTLMGLQLGGMLGGGTVIIENVFARKGIGNLAINAILQRDFALTQGIVLIMAIFFVSINLIIDLLYAYINPKIRYN